jgi:hypothetical protein
MSIIITAEQKKFVFARRWGRIRTSFDPRRLDYATAWHTPDQSGRFFDSKRDVPMRLVGFSDDIVKLRHKGWFTGSEFFQDKMRGAVFQMPGRNGMSRFVAAYHESATGGFLIDLSTVYESDDSERADEHQGARDAAHAGNGMAERAAEAEREYQDAWRAGRFWAVKRQDCTEKARDLRYVLRGIRAEHDGCMHDADAAERRLVTEKLAELRAMREDCERMRADELPSREPLRSAWLDGAECGA